MATGAGPVQVYEPPSLDGVSTMNGNGKPHPDPSGLHLHAGDISEQHKGDVMELHMPHRVAYPCDVVFQDIRYSVTVAIGSNPFKKKSTQKDLIKGVTGYARSGQLMAIMGPSGSGKSTLMDVLAGRKTQGRLSGRVLINGEDAFSTKSGDTSKMSSKLMKAVSAYVVQDDSMFEFLRVREVLHYYAQLRLPETASALERNEKIHDVVTQLGLGKIIESMIGGQYVRGISGGEKRRLSIAVELLSSPPVLFLDEPTSGLSSADAYTVCKILANLARKGHTVMCTIHQPSQEIYSMFDTLLLMSAGEAIYFGPTDDALGHFRSLGFMRNELTSVPEFLLKLVTPRYEVVIEDDNASSKNLKLEDSPDAVDQEALVPGGTRHAGGNSEDDIHELHEEYKRSILGEKTTSVVEMSVAKTLPGMPAAVDKDTIKKVRNGGESASFLRQTLVLGYRNLLLFSRNPTAFVMSLVNGVVLGLILGSLFYSSVNDFLKYTGLFILLLMMNYSYFAALQDIIYERGILNREVAGELYGVGAYWLSKCVVSVPFYSIALLPFGMIMYGFLGYTSAGYYIFLNIVFSNVTAAVTEFVATLSPNFAAASALSNFFTGLSFMFGGFLVPRQSVPGWWVWLYYLSYFTYGFSGLMVNEFEGQNPTSPILMQFGLDDPAYLVGQKWSCLGMLFAFYFAYRLMTYFSLKYLNKERR